MNNFTSLFSIHYNPKNEITNEKIIFTHEIIIMEEMQ